MQFLIQSWEGDGFCIWRHVQASLSLWADRQNIHRAMVRTALSYWGAVEFASFSKLMIGYYSRNCPKLGFCIRMPNQSSPSEVAHFLNQCSIKSGRIKGDTSCDIIMERWTTLQGREWGLTSQQEGMWLRRVWDQAAFLSLPKGHHRAYLSVSAIRVTTERCTAPRWAEAGWS